MADQVTRVRVLSIPSSHVYVDNIRHPSGDNTIGWVAELVTAGAGPEAMWGPPASLRPEWVADHAETFDVAHLHFGFDAFEPRDLSRWVGELRTHGKALVFTVHDLRNPHHLDPGMHDAQLDVLVGAADAVLTLTRGVAREIRRRWGRRAIVTPHPHVVPSSWLARPRPTRAGFVIGVHLKSLRANIDALPVLVPLVEVVRELPGAALVVNVHDQLTRTDFIRHDADLISFLRAGAARGDLTLAVHKRFDDEQLWDYLMGLDLSVLPYAFGTHSGWLEACHDLGTAVLAPQHGFWREQQQAFGFAAPSGVVDPASVRDAVREAYATRPAWRAVPDDRHRQRREVAAVHASLYHRLMPPAAS